MAAGLGLDAFSEESSGSCWSELGTIGLGGAAGNLSSFVCFLTRAVCAALAGITSTAYGRHPAKLRAASSQNSGTLTRVVRVVTYIMH